MKKLLVILLFIFTIACCYGQSGWVENSYYATRGQSSIVCGNPYQVYVGTNAWGYPVYAWYKTCRRMDWKSWTGYGSGYYWNCNVYPCAWSYYSEYRTWWYYVWYDYTVQVY